MLKKSLLALSLMTLSGAALSAAPVANIKVTGLITPPTCTLNGLETETYTYEFDISPGLFPATGNLTLPAQTKNIEVVCDASTYLSFTAADERAGTELTTGTGNFGLGTYDTDTKVGYYALRMQAATVKTTAEANATSVGVLSGATYSATGAAVNKTLTSAWGTAANVLAAGQVFAADFVVTPTINGALKNSAGDAELDGLAVLTFAFGL